MTIAIDPDPGRIKITEKTMAESKVTTLNVVLAVISLISAVSVAYIVYWKGPVSVKREEIALLTAQAKQAQVQAESASKAVQESQQQITQLQGATAGPIEQGQKLCRVLQAKQWRDGLIVPRNWTITLCQDYMRKSGGTRFQLGCVYPDQINIGGEDGTIPSPNCGWQ